MRTRISFETSKTIDQSKLSVRVRAALRNLSASQLARVAIIAERNRAACVRLGVISDPAERERVIIEAADMVRTGLDEDLDAPLIPYAARQQYGVYISPQDLASAFVARRPGRKR